MLGREVVFVLGLFGNALFFDKKLMDGKEIRPY